MSGFFKKLFNRITGKKDESAQTGEQVALPAPEVDIASAAEELPAPDIVETVGVEEVGVEEVGGAEPAPTAASAAKPAKPKVPAKPAAKAKPAKPTPVKVSRQKQAPAPKVVEPSVVAEPKPVPVPLPVPPRKPPKAKSAGPVVGVIDAPKAIAPVIVPPEPKPEPPRVVGKLVKAAPVPVPVQPEEPQKKGWLSRLKVGLSKSSKSITGSITTIFAKRKLNAETLQELEDTLIQADLGLPVAERIIKAVSRSCQGAEACGSAVQFWRGEAVCGARCRGQWIGQDHHHRKAGSNCRG
jgi:fused signal recognition particle receptor